MPGITIVTDNAVSLIIVENSNKSEVDLRVEMTRPACTQMKLYGINPMVTTKIFIYNFDLISNQM